MIKTSLKQLSTNDIIKINNKIIEIYGGYITNKYISDKIESILYSCEYYFIDDVTDFDYKLLAICEILYKFLTCHIFSDGNKRTSWILFDIMLHLNNYTLITLSTEDKFNLILDIINKRVSKEELYQIIKEFLIL